MEKIDYKKIVDKAIGEKPSLVKKGFVEIQMNGGICIMPKSDFFTKDLLASTEPFEYKQQGFLPFANPPRFTEEY